MHTTPLTVLVVGATGSIGHRTRALVRDAASLTTGADVVVGDLTRADTLAEAVDDVDAVIFTHGSHGSAREAELTPGHDWKRRSERLVRASGLLYTIVRPGWFDYNAPDQHHLVMEQDDRNGAGNPSGGVISRRQIAQILVASLTSQAATSKTFELYAQQGPAQADLEPLFGALRPDAEDGLDAVLDGENMPLDQEPATVREHLLDIRDRWLSTERKSL